MHEPSGVYVPHAKHTTGLARAQDPRFGARQEVPPMWRFHVNYNQAGAPSWWLYANNNEMVAWAGESFASLSNAHRAAPAFTAGA